MYTTFDKQRLFSLILLLQANFIDTQSIEMDFRLSNIELIPDSVIVNSSSTVKILCINHQPNDIPLIIKISKNVSTDQLEIVREQLNKTTISIHMQFKDYLGIFHLFCYSEDKLNEGARADIIAIAEPEQVLLAKKCQVYARQYIKCTFRAPTIARAIRNEFPAAFKFMEYTNLEAYNSKYELLENESTNENLVFKWLPLVNGQFPDGVFMNMSIQVPYFTRLVYHFDMTPSFVIKPNFILENVEENNIRIQLEPILPFAMCLKRLRPMLSFSTNQRWTSFDSKGNMTILDNLLFDTVYQICISCRERSNDSYGIATCRRIRTSKKNYYKWIIIVIVLITCLILCLAGGLICHSRRKPQTSERPPVVLKEPVDLVDHPVIQEPLIDTKYIHLFDQPLTNH